MTMSGLRWRAAAALSPRTSSSSPKRAPSCWPLAKEKDAALLFEPAVAGGTPVLWPIAHCLAANELDLAAGILNGTTNYILTKMVAEGSGLCRHAGGRPAAGLCRGGPDRRHRGHRRLPQGLHPGRPALWQAHRPGEGLCPGDHEDHRRRCGRPPDQAGFVVKLIGQARERCPTARCCAWSPRRSSERGTRWPPSTMCSTR